MKTEIISENILKAYEREVLFLPLRALGRFFVRAYKMTGNKRYIPIIKGYFDISFPLRSQSLLEALSEEKPNIHPFIKHADPMDPKNTDRYEYYTKHPTVPIINASAELLFALHRFNLHSSTYKNEFDEIKKSVLTHNIEILYCNPETLKYDRSFAINTIFFLFNAGIIDHRDKMETIIRDIITEISPKDTLSWTKICYLLTHVLLGHSSFYEKPVSNSDWIYNYFIENYSSIKEHVSYDALSEIALCFRIKSDRSTNQELFYQKIRSDVLSLYDQDLYLGKKGIMRYYHTNYLIMMLAHPSFAFQAGPNLKE